MGASRRVRPTTWERSFSKMELQIPRFEKVLFLGGTLWDSSLVVSHTLWDTTVVCAPHLPSPDNTPSLSGVGVPAKISAPNRKLQIASDLKS